MAGRMSCAPMAVLIAVAIGAARPAHATQLPRHAGLYVIKGAAASAAPIEVPLVASTIEATARGPLIEAVMKQRFRNTTRHVMEAVYVLPLPADAAVSAMVIRHGETTIEGAIAPRAQAVARHEQAVAAGVVGALFEQERPDVFTQTITGIAPGATIEVELRWDAIAARRDGRWELAVPLVVAPRVVLGAATTVGVTGSGTSPDTDRAADASRVTPPVIERGAGAPTRFVLQTDGEVDDVTSPTHDVDAKVAGDGTRITIVDDATSRDLVVRWRTRGRPRGWIEQDAADGFIAITIEAAAVRGRRRPVRVVIALDDAAPVAGDTAVLVGQVERGVLAGLAPADHYAVRDDRGAYAWRRPRASAAGSAPPGAGGSRDLVAVLAAATAAITAGDGAQVVLVTDGLIADDAAVIAAAKAVGVPVHVVGVGAAPNRSLVHAIAAATGATARFVVGSDDAMAIGRAAIDDLARPPAVAPAITWGGLEVTDMIPAALPRLGAGQALTILARTPRVRTARARVGRDAFAFDVEPRAATFPGATTPSGLIARLWARARIAELIARGAPEAEVSALGMTHGLVTPHTAMIAVGTEVVDRAGTRMSTAVPVAAPAGMKWQPVHRYRAPNKKARSVEHDQRKGKDKGAGAGAGDVVSKGERDKAGVDRGGQRPGHVAEPTTTRGGAAAPQAEGPPPTDDAEYFGDPAASDAAGDADGGDGTVDEDGRDGAPASESIALGSTSQSYEVSGRAARRVQLALRIGGGAVIDDRARGLGTVAGRLGLRLGETPIVLGTEASLWAVGADADLALRGLVTTSVVGLARGLFDLTLGVGFHLGDVDGFAYSAGFRLGRGRFGPTLRLHGLVGRGAADALETTTAVEAGVEASF